MRRLLRTAAIGVALLVVGFALMYAMVWFAAIDKTPDKILSLATAQFFNALAAGGIYILVAVGYTMVYGIIELINFAHGDVVMVGAFVAYFISFKFLGYTGAIADPLLLLGVLAILFLITMPLLGLLGVGIERFAYRPLRNAPRLAPLITAIGVSFILNNFVQAVVTASPVPTPQLISLQSRFLVFGASIPWLYVVIFIVSLGLMAALQLFVGRTRLGRAMRSTAQDREAAQLMGVDINTTIAVTFFIGSALAGAAGIVYGLYYGQIQFTIGFFVGLKAFTAAVLGGIGNTVGAALGGLMIGFIEVSAVVVGLPRWSEALVFAVLIIVLVMRPSGLLGVSTAERA
ncbi:MAG: branched-chain amino acid ABC transporter permease [Chloroflexota bacterium]|nr:branched-chain amino acid ABC transporter permease [Chloroflexota bacterium]